MDGLIPISRWVPQTGLSGLLKLKKMTQSCVNEEWILDGPERSYGEEFEGNMVKIQYARLNSEIINKVPY